MSDSAFEPPVEPRPPLVPAPWRRLLGLALDVLIVLIVLESWELPFVELAGGWIDPNAPIIGSTPLGPRGFALSGRGGQIVGLGVTGLALALQVPFAWRASTLGLSLFGLELRADGRRAPAYLSVPWTLGAWALSLGGLIGLVTAFVASTRPELAVTSLVLALGGVGLASLNLFVGMRSGRSLLDRVLGVVIAFKAAPEEATAEADHLTGWQPRPDFVPHRPRKADEDLHAWRTHASPDPLAPIWGPDPGPMPDAPPEPAHMDHVRADDPFAAVGNRVDRGADEELAERLRRALSDPED